MNAQEARGKTEHAQRRHFHLCVDGFECELTPHNQLLRVCQESFRAPRFVALPTKPLWG
jgi:hypothetical protein